MYVPAAPVLPVPPSPSSLPLVVPPVPVPPVPVLAVPKAVAIAWICVEVSERFLMAEMLLMAEVICEAVRPRLEEEAIAP